ncbi:jg20791 [Pararge aegeria aegeria]|uniref:Jg20791 protein n=1 Tax=Pararge aegeria aegeria TaxID=348720 RepID=A0A8S4R5N0_9NEOP|nr:jg20791 [Pararge aegeria aegeria]
MDMSFPHYQDCAVFITLTSTALPRYRAILGPFHWHVWVTLTFTYLFGIFPLAFSDKHTLRHLLQDKGEVENMFWSGEALAVASYPTDKDVPPSNLAFMYDVA